LVVSYANITLLVKELSSVQRSGSMTVFMFGFVLWLLPLLGLPA